MTKSNYYHYDDDINYRYAFPHSDDETNESIAVGDWLRTCDRDTLIQIVRCNFCTHDDRCPDFPNYETATSTDLINFLNSSSRRNLWSY